MSNAKHYQVDSALRPYNFTMPDRDAPLLLALTAYYAKARSVELNLPVSQILEKANAPQFAKDFFLSQGSRFAECTLETFDQVSQEEISAYIFDKIDFLNGRRTVGETMMSLPSSVLDLSASLLKPKKTDKILDLGSGFSSFLLNARKNHGAKNTEGIEIDPTNCLYANILAAIQNEDVQLLNADIFALTEHEPCDKAFCYPDVNALVQDEKIKAYITENGIASNGKPFFMETAFILKALELLAKGGIAVFVVMQSFLMSDVFATTREFLVKNKLLKTVIRLPEWLLERTGVAPVILVLGPKGGKGNDTVKIVNASAICEKNRRGGSILTAENIQTILELCENDSKENLVLTTEQIAQKDYDLTSAPYILEAKIPLKGCKDYKPLGELVEKNITRGVQYKADYLESLRTNEDTGNFYLLAKDIQENKISRNLQHISQIPEKDKNLILKNDDILVVMVLADSVKVGVVEGLTDEQILPASNLYVIRLDKSQVEPVFVKMLFESDVGNTIFKEFSVGSAIHSVSAKFLNELLIPVPPLNVQQELVQKYNEIQKERDALKAKLEDLDKKKSRILDEVAESNP